MFVVLGLLLAFVLIVIFSNRATRACRWREDRRRDENGLRYHRCAACGAETWTEPGTPPRLCHADRA